MKKQLNKIFNINLIYYYYFFTLLIYVRYNSLISKNLEFIMSGRKRVNRNIDADFSEVCFKPCGIRRIGLDRVEIYEDEMEALRLADLESMYQQESSEKMGISRTTFSRLVESARKKIADALINKKAIRVRIRD